MRPPRAERHDDPERIAFNGATDAPLHELPLFAEPAKPFPTHPPVQQAEQRSLPLPETPEARYAAWRPTPEGDEAIAMLQTIALEWVYQGATEIHPRWLWDNARHRLKTSLDNRLQALACREVEDTTPGLTGMFKHRMRKAS